MEAKPCGATNIAIRTESEQNEKDTTARRCAAAQINSHPAEALQNQQYHCQRAGRHPCAPQHKIGVVCRLAQLYHHQQIVHLLCSTASCSRYRLHCTAPEMCLVEGRHDDAHCQSADANENRLAEDSPQAALKSQHTVYCLALTHNKCIFNNAHRVAQEDTIQTTKNRRLAFRFRNCARTPFQNS